MMENLQLDIRNFTLLFNSEDATEEQIQAFITQNFEKKTPYTINDTLFLKASEHIRFFKYPHWVLMDSTDQVIEQIPMNESVVHQELLKTYQSSSWKTLTYSNKQIRESYGYRYLLKTEDYLFIADWSHASKTYYLNVKTQKLDSLYLINNDSLLNKLIAKKGFKGIDTKKVKKTFKRLGLPYEVTSFETSSKAMEGIYNSVLYIEFLDENTLSDTVFPQLIRYLVSFNPTTKQYTFYDYKSHTVDSIAEELEDDLRLGYGHLERIHDTLWLVSTEHVQRHQPTPKVFVYLSKSPNDSLLLYKGDKLIIPTDSFYDFDGLLMGNPIRIEFFELLPSFLVYMSSPYFYRRSDNSIFNIRNYAPHATWIHDVQETSEKLIFLTEEKNVLYVYHIYKPTMKLLKREFVSKVGELKSNALLDESLNVFFVNKSGTVSLLMRK